METFYIKIKVLVLNNGKFKDRSKKNLGFFQSNSKDTFHPAMPRYNFLIKQVQRYKKQKFKNFKYRYRIRNNRGEAKSAFI